MIEWLGQMYLGFVVVMIVITALQKPDKETWKSMWIVVSIFLVVLSLALFFAHQIVMLLFG